MSASTSFQALAVDGAWLLTASPIIDERGSFARLYSTAALAARGLETSFVETSLSTNRRALTLRGMHLQESPEEVKLVRCVRGAIHDVVLDVRPGSNTYGAWAAVELRASVASTLYVPRGCAHGFLTLEDNSDVEYCISAPYVAERQRGVRWDDPTFSIVWPAAPVVISERDRSFALWGSR